MEESFLQNYRFHLEQYILEKYRLLFSYFL
jgi:hypothetical protein